MNTFIYQKLCTEFYDLSKPTLSNEEFEFYYKYIKNCKGKILEPMCGTGSFLIPMLESGFQIDGFDYSSFMLEALNEKMIDKKLSAHVWQGSLQELDHNDEYKLVFIPRGSFGLISAINDIEKSLRNIYNCLQKNGLFIFEIETVNAIPKDFNIWEDRIVYRLDGHKILLKSLVLPPENNICSFIGKYTLIKQNEILKTEEEVLRIRFYNVEDIITMLKNAGFLNCKLIKAYEYGIFPNKNDEIVVIECEKL
ncbi:class I SAM-dependent methyltransferase [Silvanigrella sp.]|jgi:SAM-dependent methyltransferase|uniref:class I SAM-dependent methyltransferase n=1 Tax=Silvanigrella sp. TaxID=2024976 RepID=UPI0037C6A0BD|nr:class I SAM-dependent methyltransferase [Silvanigrellaceae bacterium]